MWSFALSYVHTNISPTFTWYLLQCVLCNFNYEFHYKYIFFAWLIIIYWITVEYSCATCSITFGHVLSWCAFASEGLLFCAVVSIFKIKQPNNRSFEKREINPNSAEHFTLFFVLFVPFTKDVQVYCRNLRPTIKYVQVYHRIPIELMPR
jgi:hypothetical protein